MGECLRYTVVSLLVAIAIACCVLGQLLPWATVSKSTTVGSTTITAEVKYFQWDVCTYVNDVKTGDCKTYEDIVKEAGGSEWCSTQKSQAVGLRASSILATIFCSIALFFCLEKICTICTRFRSGLWQHLHRILLFLGGLVPASSAFILNLIWYTSLPSDCKGQALKDVDGSKLGGAAFLFLAAAIVIIAAFVLEVKLNDAATGASVGGGEQGQQYIPPDQPTSGSFAAAAPPPQQEIKGGQASSSQIYGI